MEVDVLASPFENLGISIGGCRDLYMDIATSLLQAPGIGMFFE